MFRQILWPVLIPSVLFAIGAGAIMSVLVLAALQIGASQGFAAVLVGLMGAVSLCCTVPAGILIDRLGDARAMYVATAAAVVVLGLIAASLAWHSPASLALYTAGLMLFAPITDVWSLARQAVVAEVMPREHLGKAMTALGGSMRAGQLIGPIIGSALILVFPIWSVFVLAGVAGLAAVTVMSLPIARTLPSTPPPSAAAGRGELDQSAASGESGTGRPAGRQARPPLDVRWQPVILAGVTIVTLAVARAIQPVAVQLWGVQIDLHPAGISLLIALGAGLELIIMFPGAYLKDRLGRVATLFGCLTVFGIGFALMVLAPSVAGMVVAVVVMALGNGLGAGVNMTIGADLSPPVGRARFLGVWALFTNTGKLGGPSLLSLLIVLVSLPAGLLTTGALAGFGAVWILVWQGRIGLPGRTPRRL